MAVQRARLRIMFCALGADLRGEQGFVSGGVNYGGSSAYDGEAPADPARAVLSLVHRDEATASAERQVGAGVPVPFHAAIHAVN